MGYKFLNTFKLLQQCRSFCIFANHLSKIKIMNELELIKDSFEKWYNSAISPENKVSIVANYSDERTLVVKAYHKVTVEMIAVGIKDNLSYILPIISYTENYNHGITTEEEAKNSILRKFLSEVFKYCSGKGKSN